MSDLGDVGGRPDSGLIFVSDASAEAERLTVALRSRGYPTVDVPLGLLAARVAVQRPALVLCDADAPEVLDVVEAICDKGSDGPTRIVFLGDSDGQIASARARLQRHASAVFTRPVEVYALLRKVEALIGAPPEASQLSGSMHPPARTPVLVPAARKPYMVDASHHEGRGSPAGKVEPRSAATKPQMPSSLPPLEVWRRARVEPEAQLSLLPDEPASANTEPPRSHMSPQLAALLAEAEQRLEDRPLRDTHSQRLTPEAELDAVLPPDVLASLDEPLDEDDDFDFDVGQGTRSGSEAGGTAPGSQSDSAVGADVDDPQSRVTNPGGPVPSQTGGTHAAPESRTDLPATDPPPTPSVAPVTPIPRSLRQQAATTSSGAADSEPARQTALNSNPPSALLQSSPRSAPPESAALAPTSRPPRLSEAVSPKPLGEQSEAAPVQGNVAPPSTTPPGAAPRPARLEGFPAQVSVVSASGALAQAIRKRSSGAMVFEDAAGIRRVVFRDGDFVIAASSVEQESLVAFLVERGDLPPDVAAGLGRRLPPFGRHAGAALIANGHLKQDELWNVLRAHAEWLLGRIIRLESGQIDWENEVPERLRSEPAVFGGSTGAEVFVETMRRVVAPERARARIGESSKLGPGPHHELLGECALGPLEAEWARRAPLDLNEAHRLGIARDIATLCLALVELGVLSAQGDQNRPAHSAPGAAEDALDDQALRSRLIARLALVQEGDYFALLGVSRSATDYEIQRAYEGLKQELRPERMLTARNADLGEELVTVLEVVDEAFEVLGDRVRRERYRRALEALPG